MSKTKNIRDGKKTVDALPKKGESMDTCATISDKYVCCNVKVLKSVTNCPYECSYCFLQNYLTNTQTGVVTDITKLLEEVETKIQAEPWRLFRIGTWELGDSLALEPQYAQAAELITAFTKYPNALLELKTKSNKVDTILNLDHQSKTVVSWSLSTEYICKTEEHKTATLPERLEAMKKCTDAGYLIGAHFDPMIYYPNWKQDYEALIQEVFKHTTPDRLAWISIGSLRFNPEQKTIMENNYPGSTLASAEMIRGDDNKLRYPKPLRIEMYNHLISCLKKYGGPNLFIYLCMERWDVWEKCIGHTPSSIAHLDHIFAHSLKTRYNLGPPLAELNQYEEVV